MFNRVLNTHLDTVAKRCIHFCVSNTINAVSVFETITLNVQLTLDISDTRYLEHFDISNKCLGPLANN